MEEAGEEADVALEEGSALQLRCCITEEEDEAAEAEELRGPTAKMRMLAGPHWGAIHGRVGVRS